MLRTDAGLKRNKLLKNIWVWELGLKRNEVIWESPWIKEKRIIKNTSGFGSLSVQRKDVLRVTLFFAPLVKQSCGDS